MTLARREFIGAATLGAAAFGTPPSAFSGGPVLAQAQATPATSLDTGAGALQGLMKHLADIPRRRDFKSVPMILDDPSQWDDAAIKLVLAYKAGPKQVWDNTVIESPWLNLMRNSLNAQVFSFKHPNFLIVSATHGSAHLALYDQATWDKYQLAKLAGDKFKRNTLIEDKTASTSPKDHQGAKGDYSPAGNSIPALMRRGVVFMGCHNAIWEQAAKLIEKGQNPDSLSHDALAADLTNHLIDGAVLTPGAVATLVELEAAGFGYAK